MPNKIICFVVILFTCSCTGRNEISTLDSARTESVGELATSQTTEFTPEKADATSQQNMPRDDKNVLADESLQFIVVTYNSLEPPNSRNYLHLCGIDGSCSLIYETSDTISSVSNFSVSERNILIISIIKGNSITLHAIDLDAPNDAIEIETSGYSYFQDSKDSMILFLNQQSSETWLPRIYTFNLDDKKKEEILIPCEVYTAKFGIRADEIFFNGSCNSVRGLYSYNVMTGMTSTILDLPVDHFSISPDRSKLRYDYFNDIVHLELFFPDGSKKVTNDQLNITSSSFIMWIDSNRLLFTQKVKGNEAKILIWDLANNTIKETGIESSAIAFSKSLDFIVKTSNSNSLSIENMKTHLSTAIVLPSDQSPNMVYFIGNSIQE